MENNLKIFKKLDTDSLLFTHIVYQIYQIIAFYSDMLNVYVHSTIFHSIQSCHDARGRYGNFSVIEIELLNCSNEGSQSKKKSDENLITEKNIINEHLKKIVETNQFIPPYQYGEKKSDIVYPLYFVDISRTVKNTTTFTVLYIDSPLAYQELQRIKQQEKNQNKEVENNGN